MRTSFPGENGDSASVPKDSPNISRGLSAETDQNVSFPKRLRHNGKGRVLATIYKRPDGSLRECFEFLFNARRHTLVLACAQQDCRNRTSTDWFSPSRVVRPSGFTRLVALGTTASADSCSRARGPLLAAAPAVLQITTILKQLLSRILTIFAIS
jgi:hypothetical protein